MRKGIHEQHGNRGRRAPGYHGVRADTVRHLTAATDPEPVSGRAGRRLSLVPRMAGARVEVRIGGRGLT